MIHLFLTGLASATELKHAANFAPDKPYSGCLICGRLFQPALPVGAFNDVERRKWQIAHSKTHSARQHENLRKSGRAFTPEAAQRLAAFGVIPLTDIGRDAINGTNEVEFALLEAPKLPEQEVESVR